jgi:hypothetical protein
MDNWCHASYISKVHSPAFRTGFAINLIVLKAQLCCPHDMEWPDGVIMYWCEDLALLLSNGVKNFKQKCYFQQGGESPDTARVQQSAMVQHTRHVAEIRNCFQQCWPRGEYVRRWTSCDLQKAWRQGAKYIKPYMYSWPTHLHAVNQLAMHRYEGTDSVFVRMIWTDTPNCVPCTDENLVSCAVECGEWTQTTL